MPTTTGSFSHLLAPGLRKVYKDDLKQWSEEYSKIANLLTSKRAYEEELMIAGLGRFSQKNESTSLLYDDPIQGGTKRYTHVTFALGFRVSREMYDDDLYGVMKKMSKSLSRSAKQTVELEFASLLDDAFTGTDFTGADDKALCARDHALTVGSTYANEPATQADLGVGSLRASSERLERTPDERGLPANIGKGSVLVVTPTFQWIAKELLKSEYKPYTADNEVNVFTDMGLSYTVNHYMSDEDAWFLLAEKAVRAINFFWRSKPTFENSDDFDTKDAKFSGFMRFSYGFTHWRGVDGSSGG